MAVYPEHGENAQQLLHYADTAMYKVKKAGQE
nr:diguanylate cyclase [Pseudomonas endophytica]